jgi:hypothetical protein
MRVWLFKLNSLSFIAFLSSFILPPSYLILAFQSLRHSRPSRSMRSKAASGPHVPAA